MGRVFSQHFAVALKGLDIWHSAAKEKQAFLFIVLSFRFVMLGLPMSEWERWPFILVQRDPRRMITGNLTRGQIRRDPESSQVFRLTSFEFLPGERTGWGPPT